MSKIKKIIRSKTVIIIVVVLIVGLGIYFIFGRKKTSYQFVSVKNGSISETVSVTGNTTPVQSVSLAFQNSGVVSRANFSIGDTVKAGAILAELNTSDLSAQLLQAEANVDAQEAALAALKIGAQPEDVATSQAALNKAEQDLANLYSSGFDVSTDAYTKTNDAVKTQLLNLFSNPETLTPTLTFGCNNAQTMTIAQSGRIDAGQALYNWQTELVGTDTSATKINSILTDGLSYLATSQGLLRSVSSCLDNAVGISSVTISTYKTSVATAQAEVNTAVKNINTLFQNISSQKILVQQLQAELLLKQAGSTAQQIDAGQAQVEATQANVASIRAKLQQSKIVAPISGVITQFDAKVGQLALPNINLVSIIGSSGFEVDAGVSETDIGKISLQNKVTMTLDAFPNETFAGTVFYIAPSETNVQGVISYQIKVSFDNPDPRIKSGLTANLDIETRRKDNTLILPQYAVLQNDQGTFVEVVQNNKIVNVPVVLGLQDQKGNTEVVSGVLDGEQVLNIGLK